MKYRIFFEVNKFQIFFETLEYFSVAPRRSVLENFIATDSRESDSRSGTVNIEPNSTDVHQILASFLPQSDGAVYCQT